MVFVGEKDGVCGGADGMNSLEEGDGIGGRDGRDGVKGGGRYEGGKNSSAFGDSLLVGLDADTAVLGDGHGLKAAVGEW